MFEGSNGVLYRLEGLHKQYTFGEPIHARFTMINQSDSTRYHVMSYNGPVFSYQIYDANGNGIYAPPGVTHTVYDFYFEPGDTLSYGSLWNQYSHTLDHTDALEVPAGKYYIKPGHLGIPTYHMGQWVTIIANDNPLSTKLYWYFADHDSVKLDLLVRNRTAQPVQYSVDPAHPLTVEYQAHQTGDILFSQRPAFHSTRVTLAAHEDAVLYRYRMAKSDSLFGGRQGSYYCRITVHGLETDITAATFVSLTTD